MDENKKYHNPDDDGINNESDNDTYDPYEEYVKDKVHEDCISAPAPQKAPAID